MLAAGAALAEASSPPPAFDVGHGCNTTRPAWLLALRERLPPLLRSHPSLRTLSVHIAKLGVSSDEVYVGELTSSADASLGSRSVRGATCEEVLDALSFIAALGLERAASNAPTPAIVPGPGAPVATVDAEPGAVEIDELSGPGDRAGAPQGVRLGAVGFALLQGKLTPAQSIALGLAFRFAWSSPGWQPLLMLGAYTTVPAQHRLYGGGIVRFEHWSTHTVACPFRYPQSGSWGLRPCLDLDVGRSNGEAFDVAGAEKHSAPWLSGGAQLRAELVLWDRLELVASAGAVAPFWYAHFFLFPDLESFTTPALGFRAGSYASLLF